MAVIGLATINVSRYAWEAKRLALNTYYQQETETVKADITSYCTHLQDTLNQRLIINLKNMAQALDESHPRLVQIKKLPDSLKEYFKNSPKNIQSIIIDDYINKLNICNVFLQIQQERRDLITDFFKKNNIKFTPVKWSPDNQVNIGAFEKNNTSPTPSQAIFESNNYLLREIEAHASFISSDDCIQSIFPSLFGDNSPSEQSTLYTFFSAFLELPFVSFLTLPASWTFSCVNFLFCNNSYYENNWRNVHEETIRNNAIQETKAHFNDTLYPILANVAYTMVHNTLRGTGVHHDKMNNLLKLIPSKYLEDAGFSSQNPTVSSERQKLLNKARKKVKARDPNLR
ncbi:MAG: hypothetical protein WBQ73_02925, partial [Candidatus Babeliales bacterium]